MEFEIRSDQGMVRSQNEDYCSAMNIEATYGQYWVFAVADGMGGHNKGEIASKIAVESLFKSLVEELGIMEEPNMVKIKEKLDKAYSFSNGQVYRSSMEEKEFSGMGTTLTTLVIHENQAIIANVGDSRCYHVQNGNIYRITKDNSLIQELLEAGAINEEEAKVHPRRNVITRAIGTDPKVKVDFYRESLDQGDYMLLVSDGVTAYLQDQEIKYIVEAKKIPKEICDELVLKANERGGKDNISAICVLI